MSWLNFRSSIRKRLILQASLIVALPVALGTFLLSHYLQMSRTQTTLRETDNLTQAVSLTVQQWDAKFSKLTQAIALDPAIQGMDSSRTQSLLKHFNSIYNDIYLMYITNAQGKMIARSDGGALIDNGDRLYVRQALAGAKIFRQAIISKTLHRPAVCFSSPILTKGNKIGGVFALCTLLEDFSVELQKLRPGTLGQILVADASDHLIVETSSEMISELRRVDQHPGFRQLKAKEKQSGTYRDQEGREWLYSARFLSSGWKILVQYDKAEVLASINQIRWSGYLLTLLLITIVALMLFWTIMSLLKPLPLLSQALQALHNGHLSERINLKMDHEFGSLAENFNAMAEKIEYLFAENKSYQDRLMETNMRLENDVIEKTQQLVLASKMSALGEMTGGIAHEINTPLATIKLLISQTLREVQEDLLDLEVLTDHLHKIDLTTDRIVKIIKGLKTFARSGDLDPMEPASVQGIIEDTIVVSEEFFKRHSIELRWNIPAETIQIQCRAVEIGQVLLNLITNAIDAIQNLPEKWLDLEVREAGEYIEISLTDSGAGIPAEVRDKMFQPFYTTKPVGKGTGIGLSISHGIVRNHNGELFVDSSCPHTRFVIRLPKVPEAGRTAA